MPIFFLAQQERSDELFFAVSPLESEEFFFSSLNRKQLHLDLEFEFFLLVSLSSNWEKVLKH